MSSTPQTAGQPMEGGRMVDHCRICKGTNLVEFLSLGVQPHCNSFLRADQLGGPELRWPLDLLYCEDCSLVQLSVVVDPEIMFRDYVYVSGTTKTLPAHFRESARELIARTGTPEGSLAVDIGSNDGTFLQAFKDEGMRVLGVDPATNVAEMANDRGIETINDFFGERVAKAVREEHGPAQLMTAAGVFFHIDDMDDVCRGVHALLDERGAFEVQAIYLGGMLENNAFDQVYHEHVSYYTLKPLIRLFERFELEVFDVGHSPIHGGSLLVYVGHRGAHPVSENVAALLEREHEAGWDGLEAYQEWARRVEALRDDLNAQIADLRAQGKRVAGYGAPAKGNTLLNYCGLGVDQLEFLAEKAPLKIGLYSPGMHLPVLDEDEAMQNPPDYLLLLPWNFSEELLRKNEDYTARGGRFIVPIPSPAIVP